MGGCGSHLASLNKMLSLSCVARSAHILHRSQFIQGRVMKNRNNKGYFSVFGGKSEAAARLNAQAACMFVLAPRVAGEQRNKSA